MSAALPVSVVIPAYNAAAYLREALASVRAQTLPPAQIVVVDDGSSDDTAAIAREAGALTVVQPNGGAARARNAGIDLAVQPWIAFLDADDRWEPQRLEAQWSLHAAAPDVLLVASDYRLVMNGRVARGGVMAALPAYRALPRRRLAGGSLVLRGDLLTAILRRNFVLPSSLLVRRSLFDRHGAYFAERERLPSGDNFVVGEDYEWLLRALRFTDVLIVERPLVDYRRGAGTLSAHGGRLRYGDAMLGAYVCASPDRYPPGVARAMRRVRPAQLRDAGLRFLAAGEPAEAAARFREALHTRPDPRSLLLALAAAPVATPLGRRFFAALLAGWRERIRPLLHGGSNEA